MEQYILPTHFQNGEISNFKYLMHLNTLARRSYNDSCSTPYSRGY